MGRCLADSLAFPSLETEASLESELYPRQRIAVKQEKEGVVVGSRYRPRFEDLRLRVLTNRLRGESSDQKEWSRTLSCSTPISS